MVGIGSEWSAPTQSGFFIGSEWLILASSDVVWCGMVWCDVVWCGVVCTGLRVAYGNLPILRQVRISKWCTEKGEASQGFNTTPPFGMTIQLQK